MKKILIANRGEIALRIMKTARDMGIATVAVYSEADASSPHVYYADEAVCIGPAPSSQSYLRGEAIVEAALRTGADAIHPGYGFLSENAAFARLVQDSGLTFIGPPPTAMEIMGDKLSAKNAVKAFGVPLVPGTDEAVSHIDQALEVARRIGLPIIIKASAGGGGKGMRLVEDIDMLEEQMQLAINEATSAFGNGAVFIEKFVEKPRHIEIQILADQHGQVVYLFERECSIQRRHQKVVEEAPSALVTPQLRRAMGQAAVNVARACGYVGAGTVEFLVDAGLNFYFLEMNTRLQVEHPVTELITGIDLVREQIRIARGEPLGYTQDDLSIRGHAIEARVYAENPWENFTPDIGTLTVYNQPSGPGIRVDDGYRQGMQIPIYYDPMIAKLITYGSTRTEAIQRMIRACRDYEIAGVHTTLPFIEYVMQHPAFLSGDFDTNFVKQHFTPDQLPAPTDEEITVAALTAAAWAYHNSNPPVISQNGQSHTSDVSLWKIRRQIY
ncbi:acetyl-CoA carboxylase biotin carboxylase subunit [Schleiferia thermophila]|uniref:Acetyl-CoA carboxylase biotin carboxylase subunit n=1 Tax=Schleiferia thermophila TaxID=884107 RepID=A0A369A6U1_9FLAO|nr:acetyl-CoA carboxylase biotin carboxylase subunit [Schleiferia thermophila]RCX04999.1 acetyl-CoA carboxylase biotin carboxylase subunit [Schleiferia thermophila]GCD79483.1 acetyl-CoA carboxylase biotin carboxylase subunit [Schleiferia thermophila]